MWSYEVLKSDSHQYTHTFAETYKNVNKLELVQANIPNTVNNVNDGVFKFTLKLNQTKESPEKILNGQIEIDPGFYSIADIGSVLYAKFMAYLNATDDFRSVTVRFEVNSRNMRCKIRIFSCDEMVLDPDSTSDVYRLLGLSGSEDSNTVDNDPAFGIHKAIDADRHMALYPNTHINVSLGDLPSRFPRFVLPLRDTISLDGVVANEIQLNPVGDLSEVQVSITLDDGSDFDSKNQTHHLLLRITHEIC